VGKYRNMIPQVVFIDDEGRVVSVGQTGTLSEKRAEAIIANRPGSLERIDTPTKAKPKAKPKAPAPKVEEPPKVEAQKPGARDARDPREEVMALGTAERAIVARALGFKGRPSRASKFLQTLPDSRTAELVEAITEIV